MQWFRRFYHDKIQKVQKSQYFDNFQVAQTILL